MHAAMDGNAQSPNALHDFAQRAITGPGNYQAFVCLVAANHAEHSRSERSRHRSRDGIATAAGCQLVGAATGDRFRHGRSPFRASKSLVLRTPSGRVVEMFIEAGVRHAGDGR